MPILLNNENLRLKRMAALVDNKSSVLDIGAAAKPNPFLRNPSIVSLDTVPTRPSRNYTGNIIGDAMDLVRLFARGEFDAIVAGEVIEHLENPMSFLRGCHTVLPLGGYLVLSTPNPNSLIERMLTLTLSRRFFYTNDHIMLFPQRWLIRMLERSGFEEVRLMSGGFPLPPFGLIPFPRPWCHQTIALAIRTS